jgi:Ca2+-binding RTX toxin-like protein
VVRYKAEKLYGNGGNDVLSGNGGYDRIAGGAGNDRIFGGAGHDALRGGANADTFIYKSAVEGGDTIFDFSAGDRFQFKAIAFKPGNFVSHAADHTALHASDHFIFNRVDDTLWYDADGSGAGKAVLIADLNDVSLTAASIWVV